MTDQLAAEELDDGTTVRASEGGDAESADGSSARGADAPQRRFGRGPKRERVTRWDRPPEPHDWRYYVGNIGKILIATGLLLFGFVAYQLWGTGIETARAQHRLEDRFEQLLVEHDADTETAPTGESSEPDEGGPSVSQPGETPAPSATATGSGDDLPLQDIVIGDVTTAVPIALDLSDRAVEQEPIPEPFRGDPLLRLEIPKIGRDDIVVPGVSLNDLKDGPGHYPDTPLPGQLGNASIAGHRTTYGAPFFDVDQLAAGDEIVTTLLNGDRFVYEVTFVEVVPASQYEVVTTTNANIAELTLTSCHPKYTARDRIVVHSVLNPEKSSNVGFPTFYELDADPDDAPIPGDDPVLSADGAAIDIIEPDSALGDLDPVDDPQPESTAVATPDASADQTPSVSTQAPSNADEPIEAPAAAPAAENEPAPIDAFSQGWFEDRGAFVQIGLWGFVLALIAFGVARVSRRFRRDSIGILVGLLPFLVALYFVYQNVNRLLPPGI